MQLRNEGFLRLFFADHLSLPGQLRLIRASAAKERAKAAQMRSSLALRPPADPLGARFPALTAHYGIGAFEFSCGWLTRLAERIEAAAPGGSAAPAEPPAPPARPAVPIKLTTTSYLILGLVSFGASSGYAIRKGADVSTQACWPTSFAQLYPQLSALARAGLLDKREDPEGGRERSAYSITPHGEAALRAWLASPRLAEVGMRNEGLLRLFFADLLAPAEQLTVLEGFRSRMARRSAGTRDQLVPLAELVDQDHGMRYPAIMAHLGVDVFANSSRLMGRLQSQLEAE
jgi:PadR family transcriptional regulator, regulatory protein AphA